MTTGGNFNGLLDDAVTKNQTVRVSFNSNYGTRENLGIGNYDLQPDPRAEQQRRLLLSAAHRQRGR